MTSVINEIPASLETESEISGGGVLSLLCLPQVSFGLQVCLQESKQAEVFATIMAAEGCLSCVDAAMPQEAGGCVEGLAAERAAVRRLVCVGIAVVTQQLLQPIALPADITVERFLPAVAPLVNPTLRQVGELLAADVAADHSGGRWQLTGRELVQVLANDVVGEAAEAFPADGAQLLLSGVRGLMAAQVGGLSEATPTGGAAVRPLLPVHQLVTRQVAGVVEASPTYIADKCLVKVGDAVHLEHAGASVRFPTEVAAAALLTSVPRLHVQVAVGLVAERLWAEVTGVGQQPVLFCLVLPQLQDSREHHPTH